MELIYWEDTLPKHPKIGGFSIQRQDPREVVKLKEQFFAAVSRYNAHYDKVTETYNVNLQGAHAFDRFYNTTTVSGTHPFVKIDERGILHVYRFNRPPIIESEGGRFNVNIELLKTPLLT